MNNRQIFDHIEQLCDTALESNDVKEQKNTLLQVLKQVRRILTSDQSTDEDRELCHKIVDAVERLLEK